MEQTKILYQKRMENLSVSDGSFWAMTYRICGWNLPLAGRKYDALYRNESFVGNNIWIVSGCHQTKNKELLSGDSGTWSIECIWIIILRKVFQIFLH